MSEADLEGGLVSPIGGTIPDLSWYILDRDLNPVPRGAVGELYIGRAGLARGYLRRPGLSATRFVPNPFPGGAGERLYRTGDLARFQADGNIEYIGRIDHQVKVRGFRIELGEIEAALAGLAGVRDAVVLAHDGVGGTQLVGYVVADSAEDAERLRESLRESLKRHLPDYMVPAHLMLLERMPLTVNGKLDRQALPQPDASLSQQAYRAPGSELEQRIAAIWSEILGVERVGLDDNFFELGGHSLLLLMLKERIGDTCQATLSISQLMTHASVAEQAACIEGQARESSLVPLNGRREGSPLFMFHPSFGSVHCYKTLAMALRIVIRSRVLSAVPCWALVARCRSGTIWLRNTPSNCCRSTPKGFSTWRDGRSAATWRWMSRPGWSSVGGRWLSSAGSMRRHRSGSKRSGTRSADAGGSPEPIHGRDAGGTARCHVSGAGRAYRTGLVIDLLRHDGR